MRCSRKGRVVEEMGEACAIIAEMEAGQLRYAYLNSVLKYCRMAETWSGESRSVVEWVGGIYTTVGGIYSMYGDVQ